MIETAVEAKPKLGFLGVGWIGKSRLEAVAKSGIAEVHALCEPNDAMRKALLKEQRCAAADDFNALLQQDIEGVAIATPSAMHAKQALQAIEKGKSVFCQKPLARTAAETRQIVEAAQRQDVLLEVDFSYRYTKALKAVKQVIDSGELGKIFAAELVFHNAYGPDKSWYYDPALSGGGCMMDLGIHLIDTLFYLFPQTEITSVNSHLLKEGQKIQNPDKEVEDYATAQLEASDGMTASITTSWNLNAGRDAIIEMKLYGSGGGVAFLNVNGSFYDFVAKKFDGTSERILAEPPDQWSGRAAVAWAQKLAAGNHFDHSALAFVKTAEILDKIYLR